MEIENIKAALTLAADLKHHLPDKYDAVRAALEAAVGALDEIHIILDGEPNEPGKAWSSDEIESVANVIIGLGFRIRDPGEGGDEEDEDDDDEAA